jgi:hypothetical protein
VENENMITSVRPFEGVKKNSTGDVSKTGNILITVTPTPSGSKKQIPSIPKLDLYLQPPTFASPTPDSLNLPLPSQPITTCRFLSLPDQFLQTTEGKINLEEEIKSILLLQTPNKTPNRTPSKSPITPNPELKSDTNPQPLTQNPNNRTPKKKAHRDFVCDSIMTFDPEIYINMWIDNTKTYGIVYVLINGIIGVNFNDGLCILCTLEKKFFFFD